MGKRKRKHKKAVVLDTPNAHPPYVELAKELSEGSEDIEQVPAERIIKQVSPRGGIRTVSQYLELRPTPIYWGIPHNWMMFSKFFTNFIRLKQMPWDNYGQTEATYLPEARNEIHNGFLDTDMPYMLMLDDDVLPPPELVEALMMHDKALVGGWYKNKRLPAPDHPIVYDWKRAWTLKGGFHGDKGFMHRKKPGKGLEKVAGMGAGCWLMRRDLAEALGPNPYSMYVESSDTFMTEDLVLCKKITDLGYDIWVDWNIECAHMVAAYV